MAKVLKNVLISDPVHASCAELLTSHGVPVTTKYNMSKAELIKEIAKYDSLIVRSETKVTPDIIEAAVNLRIIGRAGTGVDNIDLRAATNQGIIVLNTPGGNSISACELTCSLISSLARNVAQAANSMKEGRWDRKLYSGFELSGKTLGVLGFGRIGREVARRMQSFGMNIVAFDPMLSEEAAKELRVMKANLDEIWPIADYITVHTPLIPQTKNLINAVTLSKCKKGVRIINVARGGIVDEEALLNSIKSGHCGGAGLDVFTEEPPKNPITLELIKHPSVVATPHLGASTAEAQQRVAVEIAEQFLAITGVSTEYAVTGVVNSPILAASLIGDNGIWIDLAKKLGKLASRILSKNLKAPIESQTIGEGNKNKNFIHAAVGIGILSGQTKNSLNLVNAPELVKKMGFAIKESHVDGEVDAIVVRIGQHSIKGTIRNNEALLVAIDDVLFKNGVALGENTSLYRVNGPQDLGTIVNAFSVKGIAINALNSNGNWLVVETANDTDISISGFDNY